MFHSISWRLQISYGLLLLAAFVALLISSYHLEKASTLSVLDAGIQMRATRLIGGISRMELPFPQPAPGELLAVQQPRHDFLFDPEDEFPYYYRFWQNDSDPAPIFGPAVGPEVVPVPSVPAETPESGLPRERGPYRERSYRTVRGHLLIVGRDASVEFDAIQHQVTRLAIASGILLVAGLFIRHWVAKRTLRPITDISEAAKRIADGDLHERIATQGNQSELGQLAGVLNHTFDRVERAYRRQEQFTADASHELRTPVAVILSEIQSAPADSRSSEEYEEALAVCEEAAVEMQHLLQQLLTLAQFDEGRIALSGTTVDLKALAESCIEQIRPLATEKGLQLSAKIDSVTAKGDADRISQVLTNFLTNAIAYRRESGNITVVVQEADEFAEIAVSDDGIGIAENDIPQLFERFFRADRSRSSEEGHSGLGLAICKEIAEAHGGTINVESTLGEGSTFTFRFPKA